MSLDTVSLPSVRELHSACPSPVPDALPIMTLLSSKSFDFTCRRLTCCLFLGPTGNRHDCECCSWSACDGPARDVSPACGSCTGAASKTCARLPFRDCVRAFLYRVATYSPKLTVWFRCRAPRDTEGAVAGAGASGIALLHCSGDSGTGVGSAVPATPLSLAVFEVCTVVSCTAFGSFISSSLCLSFSFIPRCDVSPLLLEGCAGSARGCAMGCTHCCTCGCARGCARSKPGCGAASSLLPSAPAVACGR